MPEVYCAKCKAKKEVSEAVRETMKNGRSAIKGQCPDCGTEIYKILDKLMETTATPSGRPHLPAPDLTPNHAELVSHNS